MSRKVTDYFFPSGRECQTNSKPTKDEASSEAAIESSLSTAKRNKSTSSLSSLDSDNDTAKGLTQENIALAGSPIVPNSEGSEEGEEEEEDEELEIFTFRSRRKGQPATSLDQEMARKGGLRSASKIASTSLSSTKGGGKNLGMSKLNNEPPSYKFSLDYLVAQAQKNNARNSEIARAEKLLNEEENQLQLSGDDFAGANVIDKAAFQVAVSGDVEKAAVLEKVVQSSDAWRALEIWSFFDQDILSKRLKQDPATRANTAIAQVDLSALLGCERTILEGQHTCK